MLRTRLIVCLLLDSELHLVNTKNFIKNKYLGDPLNASYIFSNYDVDELLVLDIDASKNNRCISYDFVNALSNFTTVPLSIGGGISNLYQIQNILSLGVEKVVIGENLNNNFSFLREASDRFGSSSISSILNIKKSINTKNEYDIYTGKNKLYINNILQAAFSCQKAGAGELIINNIDNDGMLNGFDIKLMSLLNSELSIPIVAMGGCGKVDHINKILLETPLSGIACSSIFVYAYETEEVLLKYSEVKNKSIIDKKLLI